MTTPTRAAAATTAASKMMRCYSRCRFVTSSSKVSTSHASAAATYGTRVTQRTMRMKGTDARRTVSSTTTTTTTTTRGSKKK
mmetsp:Transcript_9286/g.26845  ORF Transcript_9286/g.26845 Transcript_9286/m.26845 type:complete len:82 (+) Transcript_9286:49-294(+)